MEMGNGEWEMKLLLIYPMKYCVQLERILKTRDRDIHKWVYGLPGHYRKLTYRYFLMYQFINLRNPKNCL